MRITHSAPDAQIYRGGIGEEVDALPATFGASFRAEFPTRNDASVKLYRSAKPASNLVSKHTGPETFGRASNKKFRKENTVTCPVR